MFTEEIWRPKDHRDLTNLIGDLADRLEARLEADGFIDARARIRTIIEEAVFNAWTHGNSQDPNLTITLRWKFGDVFHIEVIDQGPGFDSEAIPDPCQAENLTKPCGRGIFLIRYFASDVSWEDEGRRVLVTIGRSYIPGGAKAECLN